MFKVALIVKRFRAFLYNYFGYMQPSIEIAYPVQISPEAKIGSYTYIGQGSFVGYTNIGRYCSIGPNVSIGLGEHDMSRISTSSIFYSHPKEVLLKRRTEIGNDVWIGANAVIRQGVKIGTGAVVGANSFVNTDVKDFEVVAGSPAKKIKDRLPKELQLEILASSWWKNPPSVAGDILRELEQARNRK